MKKAFFPGSFDPFHKGHLDILKKGLKIFDYIFVIVSFNKEKNNLKNINGRFLFLKAKLKDYSNVSVILNENQMIANIAKEMGVKYIIRSARNNLDFEYELELAAINKSLNNDLETIVIIPDYKNISYESRFEKQKI